MVLEFSRLRKFRNAWARRPEKSGCLQATARPHYLRKKPQVQIAGRCAVHETQKKEKSAHGARYASTSKTCISPGPCTPVTRRSSMSPVLLGPVMSVTHEGRKGGL